MKKMTSNEIREMFLKYFESKGHLIIPSYSLIPDNDPSILWINAGVAPLKKYFDGTLIPPSKRLTSSQKCIRTNDIENVGKTARHHTFFEMLGNFSIGDYFRYEALSYAWELLTSDKYFALDKEKLYVTVYPDDIQSIDRWKELGLSDDHIIKCSNNFWDIGPGPCGPDSEIFYDRGEEFDKEGLGLKLLQEDISNDRYIEIWNNVFSQYNHEDGKERKDFEELPHKNIDTGMGLERLTCIMQGGKTNYETDLFMPIINKIEEISGKKYDESIYFKAISDHIKTLVFALSDGASFSNEGRGYVLRRILRRAERFGGKLGIKEPFMYKLTDTVRDIMGDYYKNINDNKELVDELIKKEEEMFLKTLTSGEKRLIDLIKSKEKITGSFIFKLYDTYGFPYELTKEILEEHNITVDEEEFKSCMEKQKEMARKAAKNVSGMNIQGDVTSFVCDFKFTGYDVIKDDAKVMFIADNKGNKSSIFSEGMIITNKTPFYATSGGQVGDTGIIYNDNFKAEVLSTIKNKNGIHIHNVRILNGAINVGDNVILEVDKEKRYTTQQNHSATHLLQKSLQEVLGNEVHQQGSYVDPYILRFDFNYHKKISDDEVILVEQKVNERINKKVDSKINIMNIDDAKKLGAMALFSEKYKDDVRVVTLGDSVELCGGTHVKNVGNIRSFAIKSIESKGLNIYRIEAVCDTNLETEIFKMIKPYNDEMILLFKKAKNIIESSLKEGINLSFNGKISHERPKCYKDILDNKKEVELIRKEVAILEKEYNEQKSLKLLSNLDLYAKDTEECRYGNLLIKEFDNESLNSLKILISDLSNKIDNSIVVLINKTESSVNFIAKKSPSVSNDINIGLLIKDLSKICDGNGGGSPLYAQGGGTNIKKIDMAISYLKDKLK